MQVGTYDVNERATIGQPDLFVQRDLEALTVPYGNVSVTGRNFGLDPELGLLLDESEQWYRSMGLDGLSDGLGGMGELAGFFSKIKKALKKIPKVIQKRIKKDIKILKKIRKKVTPKFLMKAEKKILGTALKMHSKITGKLGKFKPKFLRKFEGKVNKMALRVAHKVTPKFIREMTNDIISTSAIPGAGRARLQESPARSLPKWCHRGSFL